ncbi:GlcG/HbpS family heme-binding protein [Loigolactobacillus jiayinensis]|uniref:Heme-binding protein n=1 Tax=Loigolactobacillus jiayinensis TaxID=2486016 RepID=A0ABW1RAJ4_9LACO|nr:heme-binding protein [Loigolactobacillus jiayinensis]
MNTEEIRRVVKAVLAETNAERFFTRQNMQRVFDVAEAKANELKVGVTMCVADEAGNVRMMYHMPNANMVSRTLAPKKAWSAIAMKEPTMQIGPDIQPGGPLYEMSGNLDGRLVSFSGGIPLTWNDKIVGAVGVSGGLVEEDQLICETAVNAFFKGDKDNG